MPHGNSITVQHSKLSL